MQMALDQRPLRDVVATYLLDAGWTRVAAISAQLRHEERAA